ncbi:hypothetical protein DPMN_150067 [Dreissena polymorpha]|uniref:Uncharacterized protein n=1 Tax=Dreissena polymorpha TaxID=45954 RepID=A0A9D4FF11_DREPO|nr:hypothetical protein DPMN_150067 [Dreissena polymorpha]
MRAHTELGVANTYGTSSGGHIRDFKWRKHTVFKRRTHTGLKAGDKYGTLSGGNIRTSSGGHIRDSKWRTHTGLQVADT